MSIVNIRETDLMKYIVQEFNKNSLGIEFRMGTYDGDEENGLVVYAPVRDNDGRFDEKYVYNEETYAVSKKSMVVMGIDSMNGEYMPLPDVGLASYDFTLRFLVYADSPIYQVIGMAIREVRDKFVGKVSTLEVQERDIDNEDPNAPLQTHVLKIVTGANSIDFGSPIEIRKRTYLQLTFNLDVVVSKNVDFGNQFEWKIGKLINSASAQEPNREPLSSDVGQNVESFDGSIWTAVAILTPVWVEIENPGGSISQCGTCPPTNVTSIGSVCTCSLGYARYYQLQTINTTYNWQLVSTPTKMFDVIPLLVSWGTAQDSESFQNLRPFANIDSEKHKEVHNYVKSRGFAITFTFLSNYKDYIKRELFKETFKKLDKHNLYKISMQFREIDDNGDESYPVDMVFPDRTYILEEAQPSDVQWNEPVSFVVSFSPSAKKELS